MVRITKTDSSMDNLSGLTTLIVLLLAGGVVLVIAVLAILRFLAGRRRNQVVATKFVTHVGGAFAIPGIEQQLADAGLAEQPIK